MVRSHAFLTHSFQLVNKAMSGGGVWVLKVGVGDKPRAVAWWSVRRALGRPAHL